MQENNEIAVEKNRSRTVSLEQVVKVLFLFLFGGLLYYYMEILYRGYSHFSMILCGGLCFVLIGALNQKKDWNLSILSQMVIGALIITVLEFLTGVIVNLWLKWNVWDYSLEPYNILGQVCLVYSNLWFLLSFLCIVLDDFVREFVFGEKHPKYRWL